MQEQPRPLEIAFMGWNTDITSYFLGCFADDNPEQVAQRRRERLTLIDAPEPCRECHTQAYTAAGALTEELSAAITETGKVFIKVSVSADDAAEAFRRAAEVTRSILNPETEIALIRANPGLSRFQKWRLVKQIKRRTP